jgi:hypothetical protein
MAHETEAELWARLAEQAAQDEVADLDRLHGEHILAAFKARNEDAKRRNPYAWLFELPKDAGDSDG